MNSEQLGLAMPFTPFSEELLVTLSKDLSLPDNGQTVKRLADKAPGGAFDPRDLDGIPVEALGYKAKWATVRYSYYGLEWDITGLRLESQNPEAKQLPWIVIINGGSANFYEFYLDPFNQPGLGQYLAQKINVLLVSIPGNFKYGGWTVPLPHRSPQYLLDRDISEDEVKVRNAVYTNKMEIEGLKQLILQQTSGDILIVGHSTSGELTFMSIGEEELAKRLKGRFLGWGSGGPSNLMKEWEEKVGLRESSINRFSKYSPLLQLRTRSPQGYVNSGFIGPLNPCRKPGMNDLDVAQVWFSQVERQRPNIKQVLQDLEHRGMVEFQLKIEAELGRTLAKTKLPVKVDDVLKDIFAANNAPLSVYKKMVWIVGKWDKGHWNRETPEKSRELTTANHFRQLNPEAEFRVLLLDVPMSHYGHIEMPKELSGGMLAAVRWLVENGRL
jgi:hypothetical protein